MLDFGNCCVQSAGPAAGGTSSSTAARTRARRRGPTFSTSFTRRRARRSSTARRRKIPPRDGCRLTMGILLPDRVRRHRERHHPPTVSNLHASAVSGIQAGGRRDEQPRDEPVATASATGSFRGVSRMESSPSAGRNAGVMLFPQGSAPWAIPLGVRTGTGC